jgi:hypothetical protein
VTATSQFFKGKNIKFESANGPLLERWGLTKDDVIGLCAVPNDASVQLKSKVRWTKTEVPDGEQVPIGLHVRVTQQELFAEPSEFVIFREPNECRSLYYKLVIARAEPLSDPGFLLKGMGGEMIQRSVSTAQRLGFGRIRMLAAGGRTWPDRDEVTGNRWFGYLAWPRYGFNMPLLDSDKGLFRHFEHFPRELSTCNTVLALLSLAGGSDYWKVCGSGSYMEFDLREGSESAVKLADWCETASGSRGTEMVNVKKKVKVQVDGTQQARFRGTPAKTLGPLSPLPSLDNAQSGASVEEVKRLRRCGGVELPLEILD